MADIELVIKIPEKTVNEIRDNVMFAWTIPSDIRWDVTSAIVNGTPLPKGHKRLIEVNENLYQEIRKWVGVGMASELLDNAPTIVAEDRGSEE